MVALRLRCTHDNIVEATVEVGSSHPHEDIAVLRPIELGYPRDFGVLEHLLLGLVSKWRLHLIVSTPLC